MVDASRPVETGSTGRSEGEYKKEQARVKDYTPAVERRLGRHSLRLLKLAGVRGRDLTGTSILELGGGPYNVFGKRAEYVTSHGGNYHVLDTDPTVVNGAREEAAQQGKPYLDRADIQQGNANTLQEGLVGKQDAVIINRISGGATPQQCETMLTDLKRLLQTKPQESIAQAIFYLERFINNRAHIGTEADGTISGYRKHVLVLINAFLALKEGGKLVFAHNDKGPMQSNSGQIEAMLESIGFINIQREDWYVRNRLLHATELPHVAMKRLAGGAVEYADYDVTRIAAEKPTNTPGAFLEAYS